jgi:hypothetical protein
MCLNKTYNKVCIGKHSSDKECPVLGCGAMDPHKATSQKTAFFIITTVKTLILTFV